MTERRRVAAHPALPAAEGQVDHGALPRHGDGQGGDVLLGQGGMEAQSALGRAAGGVVVDPPADEHLDAAVVAPDGHGHLEDPLGAGQDGEDVVLQADELGRFLEPLDLAPATGRTARTGGAAAAGDVGRLRWCREDRAPSSPPRRYRVHSPATAEELGQSGDQWVRFEALCRDPGDVVGVVAGARRCRRVDRLRRRNRGSRSGTGRGRRPSARPSRGTAHASPRGRSPPPPPGRRRP